MLRCTLDTIISVILQMEIIRHISHLEPLAALTFSLIGLWHHQPHR